jgi:ceramide glucosyltransferase
MEIVTAALAAASLGGSAYTLLAASAVRRFVRLPAGRAAASPPVTVLKPLHGAEAELYGNLRSFCAQLYPRFQIIFGVRDETDPAIAVVRRLVAELPDVDIALVVDSRVEGNNFKVSNLENMVALAKHDIFVM